MDALAEAGTRTVFALSGNQIMPLFDASLGAGIRLVHARHEAACIHMAEGAAQISGGVGVALVTAGAGLGNAVGALIGARASDTPLLLLSGDSPAGADGRGAFQEMDQVALTASVSKHSERVTDPDALAGAVARALHIAVSGRPGPVHLSLPADVLTAPAEGGHGPVPSPAASGPIPDALTGAARPLVLLGPSLNATRAPGLADALAARLGAPVLAHESPRGLSDPSLGRLREVAARADLVLCLGKPVDFSLGFGAEDAWPNARWGAVLGEAAQVEQARRNLGARLGWALEAPPRAVAEMLATGEPDDARTAWREEVAALVSERVAADGPGITPSVLCAAVQRRLDASPASILVVDGGEFGQWAQALCRGPRRIVNGTAGAIGGAIGQAMGAAAMSPGAPVVAMMGDGTAGFHLPEFETAVREGLPFVAVVGNDRCWSAEARIQARDYGADRVHGCELSDARYDLAARALGAFGARVTEAGDLDGALEAAFASGRPALIDVALEGAPAPTL